jgi:hypothetical protein
MMRNDSLDELVQLSSGSLGLRGESVQLPAIGDAAGLALLLERVNGFVAFEGALRVRGLGDLAGDLIGWNRPDGWRSHYGAIARGMFFFAEDVFGNQFALSDDAVLLFDAETGEVENLGADIASWADAILADAQVLTGYPLAHAWQVAAGRPISPSSCLVPKTPFVLGGAYSLDNLFEMPTERAMRLRGDLATQLYELPDGATISLELGD